MFVDDGLAKTAEAPVDDAGQLLLDAADLLEKYGWQTGTYGSRHAGFCVHGALKEASRYKLHLPLMSARNRLLRHKGFSSTDEIERWNDTAAFSKEHVVATLRDAARYKELA